MTGKIVLIRVGRNHQGTEMNTIRILADWIKPLRERDKTGDQITMSTAVRMTKILMITIEIMLTKSGNLRKV